MKKILLPALFLPSFAYGQDYDSGSWLDANRLGVGVQAGTLGIGGHLTYDVNPWFYVKAEVSGLGLDFDQEIDDIDFGGDLDMFAAGLTANFRPFHANSFGRVFRFTAGAYLVDLEFDASPNGGTIELDGTDYAIDGGNTVNGGFAIDNFAPYVGFGLDFAFGDEDSFTISLDLGAVFVGSPDVSLDGTGVFAAGGAAFGDVQAEEAELREDVKDFEVLPVLQLSATYRF